MRVLDLGCGAGDVSMLAAELVGGSGDRLSASIATKMSSLSPGNGLEGACWCLVLCGDSTVESPVSLDKVGF